MAILSNWMTCGSSEADAEGEANEDVAVEKDPSDYQNLVS
jgi:hypothetical protein